MKIQRLILDNFGPFSHYELDLPTDNHAFVLMTGKNNAGKTSILRALRLIDAAFKHANGSTTSIHKPLSSNYFRDLNLVRLIHGFEHGFANIVAVLDSGRKYESI